MPPTNDELIDFFSVQPVTCNEVRLSMKLSLLLSRAQNNACVSHNDWSCLSSLQPWWASVKVCYLRSLVIVFVYLMNRMSTFYVFLDTIDCSLSDRGATRQLSFCPCTLLCSVLVTLCFHLNGTPLKILVRPKPPSKHLFAMCPPLTIDHFQAHSLKRMWRHLTSFRMEVIFSLIMRWGSSSMAFTLASSSNHSPAFFTSMSGCLKSTKRWSFG